MMKSFVIALSIVAVGCGSTGNAAVDGGVAVDAGALTASTFSVAIERAECQQYVRCGFADDLASCDALIGSYAGYAQFVQLESDVADGKVVFNATQAQACIDAVADASCDQNIGIAGSRDIPTACTDYVTGTIADGVACSAYDECQSGSCLLASQCPVNTCCAGTCNTAVVIGGSCEHENTVCAPGAFCDPTETCAALLPAESACERSTDCRDGLACTNSICTALPTVGQACNATDGCQGINLACSAPDQNTLGTCVAEVARGATCDPAPCKLDSICDVAGSATCIALPTAGAPCLFGSCAGGTACDNSVSPGRCKALVENGGACSSNALCISDFCSGLGAPGAVCAAPPVCGN